MGRLVEPQDQLLDPKAEVLQRLVRGGVPHADAVWLTDVACHAPLLGDENTNTLLIEQEVPFFTEVLCDEIIVKAFREYKTTDAALLYLLHRIPEMSTQNHGQRMPRHTDGHFVIFNELQESVLPFWLQRKPSIDFTTAALQMPCQGNPYWRITFRHLLGKGMLNFEAFLNLDELRKQGTKILRWGNEHLEDPHRLEFWLDCSPEAALHQFHVILQKYFDPELALGFDFVLTNWVSIRIGHVHPSWFDDPSWVKVAPYLRPFFHEIDRRMAVTLPNPLLKTVWWRFALRGYATDVTSLEGSIRKRLIASVTEEMGRLRTLVSSADAPESEAEFQKVTTWLGSDAMSVLVYFGELWNAVKLLLLAFRKLNKLSVCEDLRYWHEPSFPIPPKVWNWIPERIAGLLHWRLGVDQIHDRDLIKFRCEFSKFCLDRLKTRLDGKSRPNLSKSNDSTVKSDSSKLTNEDFVEQTPTWRLCYIRAVRELAVNPEGKGHQILFWSAKNDPNTEVGEAARVAYDEIRHARELRRGQSPRRKIFAAFWWLRQAHYLTVMTHADRPLDAAGAQRTRAKELRRTREKEEQEKTEAETSA